jgi:hypothetical protein
MATAIDVLNVARSQIGFHEGASNENPYGIWYGIPNASYCAMGISWCFAQVGLSNLIAAQTIKGFSYNPAALPWFQRQGLVVNKMSMQMGDLVFYDWNGDGVVDHVELCEMASPGGFTTIAFNTGSPNDPTKEGCWRVHRNYLFVMAVVRPKYPIPLKPTTSVTTGKKAIAGVTGTATALTGGLLYTHPGTTANTTNTSTQTTVFVAPPFPSSQASFVIGQTNDAVWTVQKALEKAGLLPKVYDTGTMNTQTRAALVKYESKQRITVAKDTIPQIIYDQLKGTL